MRHIQALLLFINTAAIYFSRLNIGVALVAMTNSETANPDFQEFDWNEKQISYILSSFFWGYIFTQFPGGFLCRRFGAKMVMAMATFISALLSVLTPWCVGWGGWKIFCALRIVMGLVQGVYFPCFYEHLAKWSPKEERNRLGAFSLSGTDCGTILAMAISGIIAHGPMGWPGISYVSAAICFFACALLLILGANNPSESRFISTEEKNYIESSLAHKVNFHKQKIPIPWRAIFTSAPFYALLIARSAQNWGLSTMQSQIPSYLNGVLGMDIKTNGFYSALPFAGMWVMSYIYLSAGDLLQHKEIVSLKVLRRTFNSLAFWLPAIGLIGIGFLDDNSMALAITLMTLSVALNSGNIIGSALNVIDLSPNHTGFLMSVINAIANVTPMISPLVVGVVVTDTHNRFQWQIVFALTAIIYFLANLYYIIVGRVETQPWDAQDFLTLPTDLEAKPDNIGKDIEWSMKDKDKAKEDHESLSKDIDLYIKNNGTRKKNNEELSNDIELSMKEEEKSLENTKELSKGIDLPVIENEIIEENAKRLSAVR